jgi:magnesium-transporting ATPase (P-type)
MVFQIFNVFNARSDKQSGFSELFRNHWLWGAVLLSLLLQVAVIYIPFLQPSLFDREFELRRLAALCGGGELGAVAARVEQGYYANEKPKSRHLPCRKLARREYRTCCGKRASRIPGQ